MHNTKRHLLDDIRQELCLPEIDAESCVHALCNDSDCHACVDACPTQAWVLDDETLGLDIEACDGCGLCVPACPTGALHIHFPWVTRQLGAQMVALFACDKSGINESNGILSCIHALGVRQLLQLYNAGIRHLLLATAQCNDCSRYQTEGIYQRVEQINHLLIERGKSPLIIMQRSNTVWTKVFRTDETVTRGTQVSRRNFLSAGGQQLRQQMVIIDPLNLSEFQTIPPGQLLPDYESDQIHWPWVPELNENNCNGCDACINLCPTDALKLVHSDTVSSDMNENNLQQMPQQTMYQINPQSCTGCGICTAACESDAISIHPWSLSAATQIHLLQKDCTACGNAFHLPEQHSLSDEVLCRICQHHNHSRNLYQIVD